MTNFYLKSLSISFLALLILFQNCDIKLQDIEPKIIDPSAHQITFDFTIWRYYEPTWSPDGSCLATSRQFYSTTFFYHSLTGERSDSYFKIRDDIKGRFSFSPDGQKLAYHSDTRGHIWIYSITDDSEMLLTPDDSLAFDPDWSPDGTQIAYATRKNYVNYHLMTVPSQGGSPTSLFSDTRIQLTYPSWSPDGEVIACNYYDHFYGGRQIALLALIDDSLTTVTSDSFISRNPDWSPDGSKIAFYSRKLGTYSIWLISRDGSELHILTNKIMDYDLYPSWSPDGSKIVIGSSNYQTFIYSIEADNLVMINSTGLLFPQWLPGGQGLIASRFLSIASGEIYVISLASLQATKITNPTETNPDRHPTWFPDRAEILFSRRSQGIFKISDQGSQETKIFSGYFYNPEISKDGNKIIFDDNRDIWVGDIESKKIRSVTKNVTVSLRQSSWSPDTTRFVCCSRDSLYIFRIQSDSVIKEVSFPGHFSHPHWSVEHPVFGSNIAVSESGKIYMISPDTKDIRPIIQHGEYPCWSPDGTKLALVDGNIFILHVLIDLTP